MNAKECIPIVLDQRVLASLSENEVYVQDLTSICPTYEIRYFKNI